MYIYCITNLVNGKIYVGQHAGWDLQAYLASNIRHAFTESRKNNKPVLYSAIRKYGTDAFVITSLVQTADKSQTNLLEQFFIRTLETRNPQIGYNLAAGGSGGNTREGRRHRSSTKEKMRRAQLGRPKSEEHRKSLSTAKLGKLCPAVSESNVRRRNPNPTKAALRNRRYREKLKRDNLNGLIGKGREPSGSIIC
jgi:group I intron endonuclease